MPANGALPHDRDYRRPDYVLRAYDISSLKMQMPATTVGRRSVGPSGRRRAVKKASSFNRKAFLLFHWKASLLFNRRAFQSLLSTRPKMLTLQQKLFSWTKKLFSFNQKSLIFNWKALPSIKNLVLNKKKRLLDQKNSPIKNPYRQPARKPLSWKSKCLMPSQKKTNVQQTRHWRAGRRGGSGD